ncbi:MAG: hypothetical protein ABI134_09325, partial [Byssovorax sp.]
DLYELQDGLEQTAVGKINDVVETPFGLHMTAPFRRRLDAAESCAALVRHQAIDELCQDRKTP